MDAFAAIVASNPDLQNLDKEPTVANPAPSTPEPRSTTPERGGLAVAASLAAAGLAVADWRVQAVCFAGAALVASATVYANSRSVAARNDRAASEAHAATARLEAEAYIGNVADSDEEID